MPAGEPAACPAFRMNVTFMRIDRLNVTLMRNEEKKRRGDAWRDVEPRSCNLSAAVRRAGLGTTRGEPVPLFMAHLLSAIVIPKSRWAEANTSPSMGRARA